MLPAVLLLLTEALSSCSAPSKTPVAMPFHGEAVIYDQYAQCDAFVLKVTGAPPSAGLVYQAWLLGPHGPLSLGILTSKNGNIVFHWNSPKGSNLVQTYNAFETTWEPGPGSRTPTGKVVFSGQFPLLGAKLFRESGPAPQAPALGLQSQVDLSVEHAGMAKAAAQLEDWSEMKAHLEHVINILEGRHGALFGDYLGTGVPQNPGDGWGAKTYANEVKDLLLSAGHSSVTAVYQDFQVETNKVEDTCLAMLKHFQGAKVPSLLAELTKTITHLKTGPTRELYHLAQQTLTIPLERP